MLVDSISALDYMDQAALEELKASCKLLHIPSNGTSKVSLFDQLDTDDDGILAGRFCETDWEFQSSEAAEDLLRETAWCL